MRERHRQALLGNEQSNGGSCAEAKEATADEEMARGNDVEEEKGSTEGIKSSNEKPGTATEGDERSKQAHGESTREKADEQEGRGGSGNGEPPGYSAWRLAMWRLVNHNKFQVRNCPWVITMAKGEGRQNRLYVFDAPVNGMQVRTRIVCV